MANRDYGDRPRRDGWRGEEWESGPFGGRSSRGDWDDRFDGSRGRVSGRERFYESRGYDPDERPYSDFGGAFGSSTSPIPWYGRYGSTDRDSYRDRHYGRGPRGYRRSDARVEEDINDRLTWHPSIDASEIVVAVENGEVTLSGVVEDRRAKRLAEDIAEDVFGVHDVHNQLKIRHGFLAGLTGEKAEEREVTPNVEREGSETARRGGRGSSTSTSGSNRSTRSR